MIISANCVAYDASGTLKLVPIKIEDIQVPYDAVLVVDGSTSITGMAILRQSDGAIGYTLFFEREKDSESPVRYKVMLKKSVEQLLKNNRSIWRVFYEEPFVGHVSAVSNLFMLRSFIEEIIIENEPELDYVKKTEISNKKWKKLFLHPDKCPNSSALEKEAIKKKLLASVPYLNSQPQDVLDAVAMGFVAIVHMGAGTDDTLESTKKAQSFQYNITFVASDDDEAAFADLYEIYKGPKFLMENGIGLVEIPARKNFDKEVYKAMSDEDKILVVKYKSSDHGNITLKHKVGSLASMHEFMYAMIWRKSRKK